MSATDTARNAILGNPPSPTHEPSREGVIAAFAELEQSISNLALSAVSVVKETRALLEADLDYDEGAVGIVYADPTPANNDLYIKVGASGSGSWTLTSAFHDIVTDIASPYATLALASRAVLDIPIYAMRREASNAVRVWAGAGTFQVEGEAEVAVAAPGEQLMNDGDGYFYLASTGTFDAFALSDTGDDWQSSGDYYLLFANIGGQLIGPWRDARHTSQFRVVKTGDDIQIYTPELAPFTNKHMRLSFQRITSGTRKNVWDWIAPVLCYRNSTGTYTDIVLATDVHTKGVVLQQHGKSAVGGEFGNHRVIGQTFIWINGDRVTDTNGSWLADTWEIGQHTALIDPDSVGDGSSISTWVAIASIFWKAHMDGTSPALSLLLDFEPLSDISIAQLQIGSTAPQWSSAGAGCFDTVYRGPQWWEHKLDDETPFEEFASKDTIVKYAGEGLGIGPDNHIVTGKGATMSVEIMPGSDWTDPDRSTVISAAVYGKAVFNWMGRAYAPATPAGTKMRARVAWRFGFKGDY